MMSRPRIAAAVATCMLLLATPATAQTVTGTVFDGATGAPISSGIITLLTEPGEAAARVEADSTGRFTLVAPRPGSYFLRGERIGYRAVTEGVFDLAEGGTIEVAIHLLTKPVELEGVEVSVTGESAIARRQREFLEARGYYGRKEAGFGMFVEVDSLDLVPFQSSELFKRMPGVSKFPGDTITLTRCARFVGYVNGIRVFQGSSWDMSLDVDIGSIAAVEVYPSLARVPLQWGGLSGCGAILVWTR